MNKGLWTWPSDPKGQRRTLRRIAASPHLMAAFQGIVKSKTGLSNSELDELLTDNSNWMTLWPVRQLLALGFVEYTVDLFGGSGKYVATGLGRGALSAITGQSALQGVTPGQVPRPIQPART